MDVDRRTDDESNCDLLSSFCAINDASCKTNLFPRKNVLVIYKFLF